MLTVGIIGGIGPESTIDYYKRIVAGFQSRSRTEDYPQIVINSINMKQMLSLVSDRQLDALSDMLLYEIARLARAGADFGVLASNTPHIVFDTVRASSPIPLISIVEATCEAAGKMGLERVGLLGTMFTMSGGFYQSTFRVRGIEVISPSVEDQSYIHDKYMNELVLGVFEEETKLGVLDVVDRMSNESGIDGLVLGGTELPLILDQSEIPGVPTLDTTAIHVQAILDALEPTSA